MWIRPSLAVIAVAVVLAAAWRSPIDSAAEAQVEATSATVSVGEFLDPLNDLVEQFSDLMLLACVSFGIQRLLIEFGQHWVANALVTSATLIWLAFLLFRVRPPTLVATFLVLALMIRFAGARSRYRGLRTTAVWPIADDAPPAPASTAPPAPERRGLLGRFKDWVSERVDDVQSIPEKLSPSRVVDAVKRKIDEFNTKAETAAQQIIDLTVVSILQTVIVPIGTLLVIGNPDVARTVTGVTG